MPHPPELGLSPPPIAGWSSLVDLALAEDIGPGDVTSRITIHRDAKGHARIEARSATIACGLFVADEVFRRVDDGLVRTRLVDEGTAVSAGSVLMHIEGSLRAILAAERTALNFLGRMCGIAAHTHRHVEAVAGTGVQVVDTRKTLPGWRALDKFAVRAGGGINHRYALFDGILLKDNHVAAAGGVGAAVKSAMRLAPANIRLQVEVESADQALEAVEAGADFLLLDNRSPQECREIARLLSGRALLEASGGITLDNIRAYAESGIQRISLGALTHSVLAADVALELAGDEAGRG